MNCMHQTFNVMLVITYYKHVLYQHNIFVIASIRVHQFNDQTSKK